MPIKLKMYVAFASILTLVGCSDKESINLPAYKITDDSVKGNIKRTVEVQLNSRTDEVTLRALAAEIHSLSSEDVQRTFIGYRIVGYHENQSYWATTNYNPDLKVQILGETADEYEKIKKAPIPDGEILGAWMANWGQEYKMTAYSHEGKTFIRSDFGNGSFADKSYGLSQTVNGKKLQDDAGEEIGEYFMINENGDLEFWSENGNYYIAPKI